MYISIDREQPGIFLITLSMKRKEKDKKNAV
jgi:hypothetical protein